MSEEEERAIVIRFWTWPSVYARLRTVVVRAGNKGQPPYSRRTAKKPVRFSFSAHARGRAHGVRFAEIGSVLQEDSHDLRVAPTAGPAKRGVLEPTVANVCACASTCAKRIDC